MGKKNKKAKSANPAVEERYWSPLARQKFRTGETIAIIARHLVPLCGVLFFGASAENFLLLSIFGIAFTIACIGTMGLVMSVQDTINSKGLANKIATWIFLIAINLFVSLFLTAMFGWVLALFASESAMGLWNAPLGWSVLAIIVCALPGLYRQYSDDMNSKMSETDIKKRDQPQVLVHVLCAGMLFMMSGYVGDWGYYGLIAMAILVTALFIFRDLRPDLMRELTRPSNRPPGRDS